MEGCCFEVSIYYVNFRKINSPFSQYINKVSQTNHKNGKYHYLVKTFGYPENINDILKGEVLDSKDKESWISNW